MIVGMGIDIVELARIEKSLGRFGLRFAEKILGPEELAGMPGHPLNYVAGRFAAKEALSKALGTGFYNQIRFNDFAVTRLPSGQPQATLYGAALTAMQNCGGKHAFVSITHSQLTAAAVAVLEA